MLIKKLLNLYFIVLFSFYYKFYLWLILAFISYSKNLIMKLAWFPNSIHILKHPICHVTLLYFYFIVLFYLFLFLLSLLNHTNWVVTLKKIFIYIFYPDTGSIRIIFNRIIIRIKTAIIRISEKKILSGSIWLYPVTDRNTTHCSCSNKKKIIKIN